VPDLRPKQEVLHLAAMRQAFLLPRLAALAAVASGMLGCASHSTLALDRAVMAYDRDVDELVSKLLLINIARAYRDEPMHFTTVSSIAATYSVQVNGGVGPALTGDMGYLPMPFIGVSSGENPTLSLTPMQGEEFTQRLLTPFEGSKLTMLLRQGYDVDALLRLVGAEIIVRERGDDRAFGNQPSNRTGYTSFRRMVAHLSSVQDRHALRAEPLQFTLERKVLRPDATPDDLKAFQDDPTAVRFDAESQTYFVDMHIVGRVIITNYNYSTLSTDELVALHKEANELTPADVLIDIRAAHTGGEFPIHGVLRLRSFLNVLSFVGRGIAEEPEFNVAPDPRTPKILENPVHALEIAVTKSAPEGASLCVDLKGQTFAVRPQHGYQWNKKAFSMLSQLFQMSVAPTTPPPPLITIAK
jgi:hypothetical protein